MIIKLHLPIQVCQEFEIALHEGNNVNETESEKRTQPRKRLSISRGHKGSLFGWKDYTCSPVKTSKDCVKYDFKSETRSKTFTARDTRFGVFSFNLGCDSIIISRDSQGNSFSKRFLITLIWKIWFSHILCLFIKVFH